MFKIFKKNRNDVKKAMADLFSDIQLQSFPALIMEALNDLRDPDMSLGSIARKLEGDPGMSVKILGTVNSAAFGVSREVTNLSSAVSMMGNARLETILLTHAVKGSLPVIRTPNFNMKMFWTAASRRACLARKVAQRLHPSTQSESFTAGLLQDMAVPILVKHRTEIYTRILESLRDRSHWLHELEADEFSFDHTDVGGRMAEQWNLPGYLSEAIAGHHDTDDDRKLEPGVRIASLIRHEVGPQAMAPVYERADDDYDLGKDTMKSLVAEAFAEAEEFATKIT